MIKFYGYKKCSTSNKAQKWLDQHQVQYTFQDLIQNPPTKEEFVNWLTAYQDRGIKYFFNTHGQHYREQNLKTKINTMTIDEYLKRNRVWSLIPLNSSTLDKTSFKK